MKTASETIALAKQHLNAGRYVLAGKLCSKILTEQSTHAEALHLFGITLYRIGEPDRALELIRKAIVSDPCNPEYHYNLGIINAALGYLDTAMTAYQRAIELQPDNWAALNNFGLLLYEQDRIEESVNYFQQAISVQKSFTNAYYNLGNALQAQKKPKAAIEAYDQVLKMLPDSAETRFNRSQSLLLLGNWQEGWKEYEWRFKSIEKKARLLAEKEIQRWDGSTLAGKRLLVVDEQGFGDTLQFIRYLPLVKDRGGTVIFETVVPLINLFRNFLGIDELVVRSSGSEQQIEYDFYIPLMSLPGIFDTSIETIPANIPYIIADTNKSKYWKNRLREDVFKIGIVWAGKSSEDYRQNEMSGLEHVQLQWAGQPASKFASNRLARLEYFDALTKIGDIQLFGLQKGNSADEIKTHSNSIDVINLGEEFVDFSDTAAAIENLDLIISVDTAVAHLAGAMGKPVWVLIPYVPDWRWMLDREDSPWYPTMRLFRQVQKGDWRYVFQRIADELHALVHQ